MEILIKQYLLSPRAKAQRLKTLQSSKLLAATLAVIAAADLYGQNPEVAEVTSAGTPALDSSQLCADGACTLTYQPAFFTRYAPVTALDMVNNLPGFSLDDGDNDTRGFGGAAGVVRSSSSSSSSSLLGEPRAANIGAGRGLGARPGSQVSLQNWSALRCRGLRQARHRGACPLLRSRYGKRGRPRRSVMLQIC